MDPFGHDGLSDEIVLNILAHIPDATAYLSFAGVSKRLRNLCTYEETRSPYWRLFYAQEYRIDPLELQYYLGERDWRSQFKTRALAHASMKTTTDDIPSTLYKIIHETDPDELALLLKGLSTALSAARHDWGDRKKLFFSSFGLSILTTLIASQEQNTELTLSAMRIMFLVMRESAPDDKSHWPVGCVSILSDQLQSHSADNRRVALGLLWLLCCADDLYATHFADLGAVEPIIKSLYVEQMPPILCSISILAKCETERAISQLKAADILPRVVELLGYMDYSIKASAMRILPKFEYKRVGELGGISQLLAIVQENHDKYESITMMALVVLETLSDDPYNKQLMGTDDTLAVVAGLVSQSEKTELQKLAMDVIISVIRDMAPNARRFRLIGGLDNLIQLINTSEFPDVLSVALKTLMAATADLKDNYYAESSELLKQLEGVYTKLVDIMASPTHHLIVHEAACNCLASLNQIVPISEKIATLIFDQLIELAFTKEESKPRQLQYWTVETNSRKPNVDQLAMSWLHLLGSILEHHPEVLENHLLGADIARLVANGFVAATPARVQHYLYSLSFMLQSDFAKNVIVTEELIDSLVEVGKTADEATRFLVCLSLSYIPPSPASLSIIESFITSVSYLATLSVRFSTLRIVRHLFETTNPTWMAFASWTLAYLSQNRLLRRRIKAEVPEESITALRKASVDSEMSVFITTHLNVYNKYQTILSSYS